MILGLQNNGDEVLPILFKFEYRYRAKTDKCMEALEAIFQPNRKKNPARRERRKAIPGAAFCDRKAGKGIL